MPPRGADAIIVLDQVDRPETGVVTRGLLAAIGELAAASPRCRCSPTPARVSRLAPVELQDERGRARRDAWEEWVRWTWMPRLPPPRGWQLALAVVSSSRSPSAASSAPGPNGDGRTRPVTPLARPDRCRRRRRLGHRQPDHGPRRRVRRGVRRSKSPSSRRRWSSTNSGPPEPPASRTSPACSTNSSGHAIWREGPARVDEKDTFTTPPSHQIPCTRQCEVLTAL